MLAVILLLILDYARGKIWTESNRNPDRPGAVKRELAQRIADFFEAFDPYGFRDEYIGEPERAILDTLDLLESDPEELAAQIAEAILELEETEEKELVEESRKLAQEIGRPLEYRGGHHQGDRCRVCGRVSRRGLRIQHGGAIGNIC